MSDGAPPPDDARDDPREAQLDSEHTLRFARGLELFDRGEYHDAHEELEELWSGEVGARRHLLQALIQLAVALHHRERGNFAGALSLCERAQEHLAAVAAPTCFFEPAPLRAQVAAIEQELLRERDHAEPRFDPALVPVFTAARAAARAARERLGLPPG